MYEVLRNRNYALLWIGALISTIGDWALKGALPFYVYAHTESALATGLVFIASALPWIVLSSLAGVFVDHWNPKRTMIIADLARAALVLLLLLIIVVPGLFWLVYLVSFAEACITQFFNPASIALAPHIVGKDHLQEANALGSITASLSRLIGPLLGGLLLSLAGPASTIIIDGISYLFSAMMIMLVLIPRFENSTAQMSSALTAERTNYLHDWLDGLKVVREKGILRILFLAVALASLADGTLSALFVVFPAALLHLGPPQYGAILTALGIGNLIGSFLVAQLAQRIPSTRFLWIGLLGEGSLYLLAFNSRLFPLILLFFVLSGTPTVGWQVSALTILQTTVEDHLRGRIFGTYVAVLSLFLLIGTGIGGALAAPLGIASVLNIGCGLFLVASAVALLQMRTIVSTPSQRSMEDESGNQPMTNE